MSSEDEKEEHNEPTEKPKTSRIQKQIEAFEKAREKMKGNADHRKKEKERKNEIKKQELEEKVVKKAVSIKKKELKKKAILEEISSDSDDLEKINKIAKKIANKKKESKE